jgi:hypothetical protein
MTAAIPVVVSKRSYESDDPNDIIESSISFVNASFESGLGPEDLAPDALRSYYVDYYLAQMNYGGSSQFVYNSRWHQQAITYVREGLAAIGATRHLALFEAAARSIQKFGARRLEAFFDSEYFGKNEARDELNGFGEGFFEVAREENLCSLNARWLRGLPQLSVLTIEEMKAEIKRRVAAAVDPT